MEHSNLLNENRLKELSNTMIEMLYCRNSIGIYQSLLSGALRLTKIRSNYRHSEHTLFGSISELDYITGELKIVASNKNNNKYKIVPWGTGIVGLALKNLESIKIDNVDSTTYKNINIESDPEVKSKIAIPIFIEDEPIIGATNISNGIKRIGVLNIESFYYGTFTSEDEHYLNVLSRYAAILIYRRASYKKLSDFREIEKELLKDLNIDNKFNKLIYFIAKTLEFNFINISLVNATYDLISTHYVTGLSCEEIDEFKDQNIYKINSDNIYASVINKNKFEVVEISDSRINENLLKEINQEDYIRIYLPISDSSKDQVIGVLEAAYSKKYREYIYENDFQSLQKFVEIIERTIEYNRTFEIDKIIHDLRSPIVGIRSHSSFLQRRFLSIPVSIIHSKYDDIISDCEILLNKVNDLEYIMRGQRIKRNNIGPISVYKDVICKNVSQLEYLVNNRGLLYSSIYFQHISNYNTPKIIFDKEKLNQVVYNILINAIKYAKSDKTKFKIYIDLKISYKYFFLIIRDWGIGINPNYKDKIFNQYFRCPEAINRNVSGSGLGLVISKTIMNDLGGDVILSRLSEPTEFHILIPHRN